MSPAGGPWDGARNLRDLGGRPLLDGRITVFGRVFRSGAREYVTEEGWAAARAAGLRTVVDLRNAPAETGWAPDHPVVGPESLDGVGVVSAPTEDPAEAEFLAVCGPWLDHPRSWADNARLAPDRISHVMRSIAASEPAVLVHCAGGRDRSGMVSAMLLQLAGVTPEGIAADYADGWRGAAAYSGHFWVYDHGQREWAHRHEAAPDSTDTERRLAARVPAVLDWCSSFDTTSYVTSVGLAEPDIARLRALLRP